MDPNSYAPDYGTDPMAGVAQNDPTKAPRGLLRTLVPGLYDYFTQPTPPPQIAPNAAGKVPPSDYNPNTGPAVRDIANVAGAAIVPEMAPAIAREMAYRVGPAATEVAGRFAPNANEIANYAPGIMNKIADATGIPAAVGAGISPAGAGDKRAEGLRRALGPLPDEQVGARPVAGARLSLTPEQQQQVAQWQKQIDDQTARNAAATKGMGPQGTKARNEALNVQIKPLIDQISAVRNQLNARQKTADDQLAGEQSQYDTRLGGLKTDYDARAAKFAAENAPFAQRTPGANAALSAAPALSLATGGLLGAAARGGSIGQKAAAFGVSGLSGAAEGGVAGYWPNYQDMKMPQGSEARAQAEENLDDPNYWKHEVGNEALMGAGLSALGTKFGMTKFGKGAANAASASPPASVPSYAPAAAPTAADAAKASYAAKASSEASGAVPRPFQGTVSRTFHDVRGPDGRYAKKPAQPAQYTP